MRAKIFVRRLAGAPAAMATPTPGFSESQSGFSLKLKLETRVLAKMPI